MSKGYEHVVVQSIIKKCKCSKKKFDLVNWFQTISIATLTQNFANLSALAFGNERGEGEKAQKANENKLIFVCGK